MILLFAMALAAIIATVAGFIFEKTSQFSSQPYGKRYLADSSGIAYLLLKAVTKHRKSLDKKRLPTLESLIIGVIQFINFSFLSIR
jgi:hypothetical protein